MSSSGQMAHPAAARHRWHLDLGGPVDVLDLGGPVDVLDLGGPVDVLDLGFGVLAAPKGEGRRLLTDLLSRDEHAARVRALGDDPDLATW